MPDTTEQTHCPTCGSPVTVSTAGGGKPRYLPRPGFWASWGRVCEAKLNEYIDKTRVAEAETARLKAERDAALSERDAALNHLSPKADDGQANNREEDHHGE